MLYAGVGVVCGRRVGTYTVVLLVLFSVVDMVQIVDCFDLLKMYSFIIPKIDAV